MATFDALNLSRAWLAVDQASGKDKDHPVLDQTVAVEQYDNGVRLVATDGIVLLHAWVPALGCDEDLEPGADEAPTSTVVARDPHGRGRGFLAHLLSLATADDAPPVHVNLSVCSIDEEVATGTIALDGLAAEWVALEYPGHERVLLEAYDGDYPNWRTAISSFSGQKTAAVALSPTLIGRLAKLGKVYPDAALVWRFGGQERMALIELAGSHPRVCGAAMPVRMEHFLVANDEAA